MKSIVLIGGLVAASAVAASFVYSGTRFESSPDSAGSGMPDGANMVAMSATQVLAAAKHNSPPTIFTAKVESPEALQKVFDTKGAAWATENIAPLISSPGSGGRSDCPGVADNSPQRTLHVRYVTDYPNTDQGRSTVLYSDIEVPIFGSEGRFSFESPGITEIIIRDRFEWKRNYKVRWWQGVDQDWEQRINEELDVLNERFIQAEEDNPSQAMAILREMMALKSSLKTQPVSALNETVHDSIEVEAPSPAWSFKYNNHTGKGDALYRRTGGVDSAQAVASIEQNAEAIISALEPIRKFGESLESKGTRTILGHTCEVISSAEWDAEHCVAEIDGQEITLWMRIDKAHKTAVYLDTAPCVSLAQFRPPANIDFDAEW